LGGSRRRERSADLRGGLGDERIIMPVAAYRERYGVAIGLPTVVGQEGAAGELAPSMSDAERRAFERSAETLRDAARSITSQSGKHPVLARTIMDLQSVAVANDDFINVFGSGDVGPIPGLAFWGSARSRSASSPSATRASARTWWRPGTTRAPRAWRACASTGSASRCSC
jgi:hypothetical protein